jgi:hypothetical protein
MRGRLRDFKVRSLAALGRLRSSATCAPMTCRRSLCGALSAAAILDVNANSNDVTRPSLGQWLEQPPGKKAMYLTHRGTIVPATFLLMVALAPSAARAYEKPYDPYKWCAVGSDATNCGFLTLEQCRMSSRNCEPNQSYNPSRSPSQAHRRKTR